MKDYAKIQLMLRLKKALVVAGGVVLVVLVSYFVAGVPEAAKSAAHERASGHTMLLLALCAVAATAAHVVVIVQAFRDRLVWGLATLLVPLAAIIYALVEPARCKWGIRLFLVSLVSYGLLFASME